MKEKVALILNGSHNIYKGWVSFLDSYTSLFLFDDKRIDYGKIHNREKLNSKSIKIYKMTFLEFIENPLNNISAYKKVIIGDIFINTLSFRYIFRKNVIFYTEFFFKSDDSIKKKVLFYFYTLLFRNKTFIVPTKKSEKTIKKISKKVIYFPQIYTGKRQENFSLNKKPRIIFVGTLGGHTKNLSFLLENLLPYKDKIEIGLCGSKKGFEDELNIYKNKYGRNLKYYGLLDQKSLSEQYLYHNIFVLPSTADAIGSVVLEAMAHGLPIIVSENVGASSYIEHNKNGYIMRNNNIEDLQKAISQLLEPEKRLEFGKKSFLLSKKYVLSNDNVYLKNKLKEILDKF